LAGQASGGQQLTPNNNVNAPAGVGGDQWGAYGGGITPIGTSKPVAATLSDGETAANYLPTIVNRAPPTPAVLGQENVGALSGQALDSSLASGGVNVG